jgi:hypothetical protein
MGEGMGLRERFWEFRGTAGIGDWYFRSSDYDVEINEENWLAFHTALPKKPFEIVKRTRREGQIFESCRSGCSITERQAKAAHQWANEQDLFGQSDRGVTRVDVPDSITGF